MSDTEGAVQDMRLAHSYLEDWVEAKTHDEERKLLALATKYIESARSKDPTATVQVQTAYGKRTFTINGLTSQSLQHEAAPYFKYRANKKQMRKGIVLLKKALEYEPNSTWIRKEIARESLNIYDYPTALAMAQECVALVPNDVETRKFLDQIEAAPRTAPTLVETDPAFALMLGSLAIFALSVLLYIFADFWSGFYVMLLSFGVLFISSKMNDFAVDRKAREEVARTGGGRNG